MAYEQKGTDAEPRTLTGTSGPIRLSRRSRRGKAAELRVTHRTGPQAAYNLRQFHGDGNTVNLQWQIRLQHSRRRIRGPELGTLQSRSSFFNRGGTAAQRRDEHFYRSDRAEKEARRLRRGVAVSPEASSSKGDRRGYRKARNTQAPSPWSPIGDDLELFAGREVIDQARPSSSIQAGDIEKARTRGSHRHNEFEVHFSNRQAEQPSTASSSSTPFRPGCAARSDDFSYYIGPRRR